MSASAIWSHVLVMCSFRYLSDGSLMSILLSFSPFLHPEFVQLSLQACHNPLASASSIVTGNGWPSTWFSGLLSLLLFPSLSGSIFHCNARFWPEKGVNWIGLSKTKLRMMFLVPNLALYSCSSLVSILWLVPLFSLWPIKLQDLDPIVSHCVLEGAELSWRSKDLYWLLHCPAVNHFLGNLQHVQAPELTNRVSGCHNCWAVNHLLVWCSACAHPE